MRRKTLSVNRGTTLIEALVYTVVFGLVLSCIYWVLIASMRYYHIANDSIELQQNALVTMSTLTQELSESRATTILSFSDPDGIIFCSPRNANNQFSYAPLTLGLLWSKWVCYYIGTSGGVSYLYKKEYYKTPALETPVVPSDHDTLAEFTNDLTLPRRTVGKYIDDLEIDLSGLAQGEVKITASFNKSPNPEKGNRLQIKSESKLRN